MVGILLAGDNAGAIARAEKKQLQRCSAARQARPTGDGPWRYLVLAARDADGQHVSPPLKTHRIEPSHAARSLASASPRKRSWGVLSAVPRGLAPGIVLSLLSLRRKLLVLALLAGLNLQAVQHTLLRPGSVAPQQPWRQLLWYPLLKSP
ncbi:hypothetical protein TASIC1_0014006700 [Trichoderma asperellum]|uniref:Uncharacterized protein n=1 Tax=Trichoderma asperellum TaxID=101201 RepID=A0A6V8R6B4_TRIAP|nr:hypothetical protein TASIC1_0014006700 [Trichoderma asperellum]